MHVRKHQCISCPFKEDGLKLDTEKMGEIFSYLITGTNHFCHSDYRDNAVCRGGRNYQLDIWAKIGLIDEPTDTALYKAMRESGVEPKL